MTKNDVTNYLWRHDDVEEEEEIEELKKDIAVLRAELQDMKDRGKLMPVKTEAIEASDTNVHMVAIRIAFERGHSVAVVYYHNSLWYATSHTEESYLDICGVAPFDAEIGYKKRGEKWTLFVPSTLEEADEMIQNYCALLRALTNDEAARQLEEILKVIGNGG